jgi:hypothetical protein
MDLYKILPSPLPLSSLVKFQRDELGGMVARIGQGMEITCGGPVGVARL